MDSMGITEDFRDIVKFLWFSFCLGSEIQMVLFFSGRRFERFSEILNVGIRTQNGNDIRTCQMDSEVYP